MNNERSMNPPHIALTGRVALVTGASGGIGSAISRLMAQAGATMVIHYYRNETSAQELTREISTMGGEGWPIQADLSSSNDVERMINDIAERYGKLDILVNNAAAHLHKRPLEHLTYDEIREVLDVNLIAPVFVTKAATPLLKRAPAAAIINISSIAAISGGTTGSNLYAAAKGGLESLTRSLAKELAPTIRVNAVSPAAVPTEFHRNVTSAERWRALEDAVPLKRLGTTEDTAWAVLFLASDAASYINGQVIQISGGRDLCF